MNLIHALFFNPCDLPAMDNDELRRGQPTCHIAFDEATAILAGDALQAFAFEILTEAPSLSAEQKLQLVKVIGSSIWRTRHVFRTKFRFNFRAQTS